MFLHKETAGNSSKGACAHMVVALEHLADGTARGPLKWLSEQHVAQCPRCAATLRKKTQEPAAGVGTEAATMSRPG